MERMTYYDSADGCYKLKDGMRDRNMVQEIGVYEDIHQKDLEKVESIGAVRDIYIKKGVRFDPFWANIGKAYKEGT